MKLFDNKVQEIKYKVLREVAVQTWKGNDVLLNLMKWQAELFRKMNRR